PRSTQIHLGQRTLGKENRIERRAQRGCNRDLPVSDALGQAKHAQERKGRDQQHGCSCHHRRIAHHSPPKRDPGEDQRRMRVRNRSVRNQTSAQENVARGRNVIAGLVPEIRQSQEREMQQEDNYEDGSKNEGRIVVRIARSTNTISRQIAQNFPRKRSQAPDLSRQTSDIGPQLRPSNSAKGLSESAVRSPRSAV